MYVEFLVLLDYCLSNDKRQTVCECTANIMTGHCINNLTPLSVRSRLEEQLCYFVGFYGVELACVFQQ